MQQPDHFRGILKMTVAGISIVRQYKGELLRLSRGSGSDLHCAEQMRSCEKEAGLCMIRHIMQSLQDDWMRPCSISCSVFQLHCSLALML